MATFIGFNTVNQYKDFTLTDLELIKRDLLNTLNTRQGERVGRPLAGTTMWNLIFEPQSQQTEILIREEIERLVGLDPRISVGKINVYAQENGLLLELEVETVGNVSVETLSLFFDQTLLTASYV